MKYPLEKDRSVTSAADFWWQLCFRRIVKMRRIATADAQRRIVILLQNEKLLSQREMAA